MNVLSCHNPCVPPGDIAWSLVPSCSFLDLHTPSAGTSVWVALSWLSSKNQLPGKHGQHQRPIQEPMEHLCQEREGCLRSGAVCGEGEDMACLLVAVFYTDSCSLNKTSPKQG